ncbi:MAG: hypothetical protein ACWGMZ_03835 [Thermoguttaceae bacterium]
MPLPVWFLSTIFYIVLSGLSGARREYGPVKDDLPEGSATQPAKAPDVLAGSQKLGYYLFGVPALLSLIVMICLGAAVFMGGLAIEDLRVYLIFTTAIYFFTSIPWIYVREKSRVS